MLSVRQPGQQELKFRTDTSLDRPATQWAVHSFSGEDLDVRITIKQTYAQKAVIAALRRAGIEMPHHITVQNDLMTGRVYILVNGIDWLTLKELTK